MVRSRACGQSHQGARRDHPIASVGNSPPHTAAALLGSGRFSLGIIEQRGYGQTANSMTRGQ
jgi:hypothetical protein